MYENLKIVVALLGVGVLLVACSLLEQKPATAELVIKIATVKAIENAPAPSVRQARVVAIADFALAKISDEVTATIDILSDAVRAEIDYASLAPADQIIVDTLLAAVEQELRSRYGDGFIAPDDRVAIASVISWVREAAEAYGKPTVP